MSEVVEVKLPVSVRAATTIMGALSLAWPDAVAVDRGPDTLAIDLRGRPSGWSPVNPGRDSDQ